MENSESKDLEQNAQTEEAPAEAEAVDEQPADDKLAAELAPVSYTHLTLPTILLV